MAKKRPKTSRKTVAEPTFEVRFEGPGITPEVVPLRAVSEALSAVQNLASGRDVFETRRVPEAKSIGLVDVKRGSAVYACVARSPTEASKNFAVVGEILQGADNETYAEQAVTAFRPIKSLSEIARANHCTVRVTVGGRKGKTLFSVAADDYDKLAGRLLVEGPTTITGTVQRVGGATEMKCVLRVPQRGPLLYCTVADSKIAQKLGNHLYESIAATGTAVWINHTWRVLEFKIHDFRQPKLGNLADAISDLRSVGLDAWDAIPDPAAYLDGSDT